MDLDKDFEEAELERLVFGNEAGLEASLRASGDLYKHESSDSESDDFFIDDQGDSAQTEASSAAWLDLDDERATVSVALARLRKLRHAPEEISLSGTTYTKRLRAQFEKIYPRPAWADALEELATDEEMLDAEDVIGDILQSTLQYVKTKHRLLPATQIAISRLKDANRQKVSKSGIQSMLFHPTHPILVTGGFDRTVRAYHIDGRTNQFVTSVHFADSPVQTCAFVPFSSTVYVGGRRKYMNRWDVRSGAVEKISRMYGQDAFQPLYEYFKVSPKGTFVALRGSSGYVNLVLCATGQFVRGLRVDGDVADFVFQLDELVLLAANVHGDIWEFAVESGTVLKRWLDASAVHVTRLALGSDRYLAIGTSLGVVNLFDRADISRPYRAVDNLVTAITEAKFLSDGQVLCIASKDKKDALRLVHTASGTVFSNWPTSGTPLGRVLTVEFSPNNQMLAIGNDIGKVTLWRLGHY